MLRFNDHHPNVANKYHNLGNVFMKSGRYNDAISVYEKVLMLKLSSLGGNHPSIANTYNIIIKQIMIRLFLCTRNH